MVPIHSISIVFSCLQTLMPGAFMKRSAWDMQGHHLNFELTMASKNYILFVLNYCGYKVYNNYSLPFWNILLFLIFDLSVNESAQH